MGLTDGTYFLVVADANGCLDSNEIILATVSSFPAPVIDSIIIDDPLCFNNPMGRYPFMLTGLELHLVMILVIPLIHKIIMFSNLSAGTYNVVVTDVNQCSSTTTIIQLQDPLQLVLVSQINNATCSYINDGNIDLTASYGGTGSLEFSIDSGITYQSSGLFQNILPGNFNLYVRDTNGCIENGTGTYLPPYPIDIQATITNPTCYGYNDAQIAFTITGGTNPDTVTWGSRPNAGYGTNPVKSIPWGNNNFITNNTIANLSSISDTIWVIDSMV